MSSLTIKFKNMLGLNNERKTSASKAKERLVFITNKNKQGFEMSEQDKQDFQSELIDLIKKYVPINDEDLNLNINDVEIDISIGINNIK